MCLVLAAYNSHPDYKLVLIANRDEFHNRPSKILHNWDSNPNILGGKDIEAGGTWLATSAAGRIATITNVRKSNSDVPALRSRGLLVTDFLETSMHIDQFNQKLIQSADNYAGYNLLTFDQSQLCCFNNVTKSVEKLAPGIYTLSNADIHTSWPKTRRIRKNFESLINTSSINFEENLFRIMRDDQQAPDEILPATGVSKRMEKQLSSIFIIGEHYGTRCTSIITIDNRGLLSFYERSYNRDGNVCGNQKLFVELGK
ncbi:MAG: NRDE family protein [Gammaproteobacteria bacterium]